MALSRTSVTTPIAHSNLPRGFARINGVASFSDRKDFPAEAGEKVKANISFRRKED
jgi:hypothetical protein